MSVPFPSWAGQQALARPSPAGQPALTSRHRSRDPVQARQPHRGGVQPRRGSPAGSQLRPPRHRRDLRLRERQLAPRRAHAANHLRPPGRHRAPAHHHHRRRHHSAARGRQRPSGTPADGHLRRQRHPLDPLASPAAGPSQAHLGILRNRRHNRDHLDREPGRHPHGRRSVAAAAFAATGHSHARARTHRRVGRPGHPRHQADRLAARTGCPDMGHHADHQRPHPVRVIRLTPTPAGHALRNHAVNRNPRGRPRIRRHRPPGAIVNRQYEHGKARYDHENLLGNRHELQPLRPSGHHRTEQTRGQVPIDLAILWVDDFDT